MRILSQGGAEIWTVTEREGPQRRPDELFPGYDLAEGDPILAAMGPTVFAPATGRLMHTYQTFVLRWRGEVWLIDTCVGEGKARPPHFGYPKDDWPRGLARAGVAPGDVAHVICTHLHVDHVGWSTRLDRGRWVPTFPNATFWFPEDDCAYWEPRALAGDDLAGRIWTDSVAPLFAEGVARRVASGHDFGNGLRLVPAPGHSPGMVRVDLDTAEGRVILASDILHNPLQVRLPGLSTVFCADPEQAAVTRRAFLDEVADTGTVVIPEHFAFPVAGTVIRQGSDFAFRYLDGRVL
jgi:glyoxylase-like metal-dependent hydrolase (beta-lactamase superfamily II)